MKKKNVLIIVILIIGLVLFRNLTDGKQTFTISKNGISDFSTNELMSKLEEKFDLENNENIYLLRSGIVTGADTDKYAGEYASIIIIEDDKFNRMIWDIAVERDKNKYDIYSIQIIDDKITIYDIEESNEIGQTDITFDSIMHSIDTVPWNKIVNKWPNAKTYDFRIENLYNNINEIKNDKAMYIIKDNELINYNDIENLNELKGQYLEFSIEFFNNNGSGKGSTMSLLVNIDGEK